MPFIESILRYRSLSIVGMEKNTGKTETLNYILRRLPRTVRAAVTSIGTDGEMKDLVTGTAKPEILLRSGTLFATAEKYYARRRLTSEVLAVDAGGTSAGQTVTARVITAGKAMLSGPSTTAGMGRWMERVRGFDPDLTIIDGALSRKSSASPTLSEAVVLATGAAFSADPAKLVRETAYTVKLIGLPLADASLRISLERCGRGVWGVTETGEVKELGMASSLSGELPGRKEMESVRAVYVSGALTERLLGIIRNADPLPAIVVEDFTKIFVSGTAFAAWERRGGEIYVMRRSRLLAVTVNPAAPSGIVLDSERLTEAIKQRTGIPAYDVRKCYDVR